jgi:hypothetical protein
MEFKLIGVLCPPYSVVGAAVSILSVVAVTECLIL